RHARSLAAHSAGVRLVAPGGRSDVADGVERVAVRLSARRAIRFAVTPWALLAAHLRRPAPIVYLHDLPLLYLLPVLRLLGRTCVYDVHEDYGNLLRHRDWIPPALRGLAGRAADAYERAFARAAAGIVAATGPLLDKFPHRSKAAVYNLPTGDVIEAGGRERTPLADREFDLVHLGTFAQRRMDFFCGVLGRLVRARPDLRMLVIGAPPAQEALWRSRFGDAVTVVARAAHADVPALLGRCRVGVSVHPWLTPHLALAVPVKLFEYMACGCAVATSRMPEFERLLDPGDLARVAVVDGPDEAAWERTLARLLGDPEAAGRAAEALRARMAERYSWSAEEGKLLGLFREVTGTAAPPGGTR
ncbi:MAG: glycosyltransferase family 4 protein, partial [Deltaproteobacteria bacterium]|nr:glycosyltransferase family 4 protein [Deltaproteobacteria bacterium]